MKNGFLGGKGEEREEEEQEKDNNALHLRITIDLIQFEHQQQTVHGEHHISGFRRPHYHLSHLQQDFSLLQQTVHSSKITLELASDEEENKKLYVDELVLCARSPVFRGMFASTSFRDTATRTIGMQHFRPEVVRHFVSYLYDARLPRWFLYRTHVSEAFPLAHDLYEMAKMYQVTPLVNACRETLVQHLSVDVVHDVYGLYEKYNDHLLKYHVKLFYSEHLDAILQHQQQQQNTYKSLTKRMKLS